MGSTPLDWENLKLNFIGPAGGQKKSKVITLISQQKQFNPPHAVGNEAKRQKSESVFGSATRTVG
jgi:hypothetical protein